MVHLTFSWILTPPPMLPRLQLEVGRQEQMQVMSQIEAKNRNIFISLTHFTRWKNISLIQLIWRKRVSLPSIIRHGLGWIFVKKTILEIHDCHLLPSSPPPCASLHRSLVSHELSSDAASAKCRGPATAASSTGPGAMWLGLNTATAKPSLQAPDWSNHWTLVSHWSLLRQPRNSRTFRPNQWKPSQGFAQICKMITCSSLSTTFNF